MIKLANCIAALVAVSGAYGASIGLTNLVGFDSTTNAIVDVGGTALGNGTGYAAAGTFSVTDADIINYTNLNDLVTAFTPVVSGNINGGGVGIDGLIALPSGANPAVNGGTVYSVIGNGADFASSTQIAIFKHTLTFAADPNPTDNAVISASASGNVDSILLGGFDNFDADFGAGDVSAYNLVNVVPEPSVALLGALGIFGLIRRRR